MKRARKLGDTVSCPLCKALEELRRVFYSKDGVPFVIVMNTVRGTPMLTLKQHRGELKGPQRTRSLEVMNEVCRKVFGERYYLVKKGVKTHWWVEGRPFTTKSVERIKYERHRESN